MSWEQTKIFYNLVKIFYEYATAHKYDEGREKLAADQVARFSRCYDAERIKAVARKANQKAKIKFYSV